MVQEKRTALITGSGQMIGRGIALRLAEAGFNVILNGSRNKKACEAVAEELKAFDIDTLIAMGNVGVKEEANKIINDGLDKFGSVDVLVNNAAVRPHTAFLDLTDDEWDEVHDINLKGPLWMIRACLPGMMENNWGRIVNFTGMMAQKGYQGAAAVASSKHANWGLIKSLSDEFGRFGITANIISPGTFPGDDFNVENDEKRKKLRDEHL